MRKYIKPGHVQGNTTVGIHSSPFIQGTVPVNSDGDIQSLADLATPWSLMLDIQAKSGSADVSIAVTLTNTNTSGGNLSSIVSLINSSAQNNSYVTAKIHAGALLIESVAAGEGSYVRINPTSHAVNGTAAYHFGFTTHPHSKATVYGGSIKSSSADTENQQNPTGTTFLADGEDRSSESYNRALAQASANIDSNRVMLEKPLGVKVNLEIPVGSGRLVTDPTTGKIIAVDLSPAISDSFSSLLESRVLVGTLDSNSTIREIRHLFSVADENGLEVSYVTKVISGSPTGSGPVVPEDLNSTPNVGVATANSVGDGGLALFTDIRKTAVNIPITGFIDNHTIECATATFIADGVEENDVVLLTGSYTTPYSNDGQYYVDKVVSETILELRAYRHTDVNILATGTVSGAVTVGTGGMWLKGVSIFLLTPVEPATITKLIVSVPLEEITGDLPEDAFLDKDIVEVSIPVSNSIGLSKTLNDVYLNATDNELSKGAGYAIDAESRPVHIYGPSYTNNAFPAVSKTATINILSDNIIEVVLGTFLLSSDVGSVATLTNVPSITGMPAEGDIIEEEVVVISKQVSPTRFLVNRVRNSTDLPATTGITIKVLDPTPSVTLPGNLALVTESGGVGSVSTVIQGVDRTPGTATPTTMSSSFVGAVLDRLPKLFPTATAPLATNPSHGPSTAYLSVAAVVSTSGNVITVSALNASAEYLKNSFKSSTYPALVCRFLNGPNSGFYLVSFIDASLNEYTLLNLDGTAATIAVASSTQFVDFYYIAECTAPFSGTAAPITHKTLFVVNYDSSYAIGLSVNTKGGAHGIYLPSNRQVSDVAELRKGRGSRGTSVLITGGPGTESGLTVSMYGMANWDGVMDSDAEISIPQSVGLGGYTINSSSATYHLDPTLNPSFYSSPTLSQEGSALFSSTTEDFALTAVKGGQSVHLSDLSTGTLNVINVLPTAYGNYDTALSVYGNVYAPANRMSSAVHPYTWYAEAVGSMYSMYTSEYDKVDDVALWGSSHEIGGEGVIARISAVSSDSSSVRAKFKNTDYSLFKVPHQFIVVIRTAVTIGGNTPDYVNFAPLDPQMYVGSHVFFADDSTINSSAVLHTSVKQLQGSYGRSDNLPFGLANTTVFSGPQKGFKVVAAKRVHSAGETYLAVQLDNPSNTSSNPPAITLGDVINDISLIVYRKPFVGRVDVADSIVFGRSNYTPVAYDFPDPASTYAGHNDPHIYAANPSYEILPDTGLHAMPGSVTEQGSLLKNTEAWDSKIITNLSNWERGTNRPNSTLTSLTGSTRKFASVNMTTTGAADLYNSSNTDLFNQNVVVLSQQGGITVEASEVTGPDGITLPYPYGSGAYKTNAFRGGGRKLVLHSRFWQTASTAATTHSVRIKVGADLPLESCGLSLSLVIAHLNPDYSKEMTVELWSGNDRLHQITDRIYPSSGISALLPESISARKYIKKVFNFSSYFVETGRKAKQDLYFRVIVTTDAGFLTHSAISSLSDQDKLNIGRAVYHKYYGGGGSPSPGTLASWSNTALDGTFPDAVFIANVAVTSTSKSLQVSSGLDIEGTARPRNLRLLKGVTGYNTVGPAQVSLLQNTEYGSGMGKASILPERALKGSFDGVPTNTVVDVNAVSLDARSDVNIETGDVGYLPLWRFMFFSREAREEVLSYIGAVGTKPQNLAAANYVFEYEELPTNYLTDVNGNPTTSLSVMSTPFVISTFSTPLENIALVAPYSALEVGFHIHLMSGIGTITYLGGEQSFSGYAFSYTGPHAFVTFYKPVFDKASFFKKGIHSAAIHAFHPYYDPMFYWLNAAYGINKGKPYDAQSVIPNSNTAGNLGNTDPAVSRFEVGSFRLNTDQSYIKLADSRVNPDALKLPGRTGFIVPIDPPHGARMSKLDLNISVRPMLSRKLTGSFTQSTSYSYSYGIWSGLPTPYGDANTLHISRGRNWTDVNEWTGKEGYIVRLWKHTLFDDGTEIGDSNSDSSTGLPGTRTTSNREKRAFGNAVCILSKTVSLRNASNSEGGTGDPADYVSDDFIDEAVSRPSLEFDIDDPSLIANREVYSYFITVEFYTGIRKVRSYESDVDNAFYDGYTIPGLSFEEMDEFNAKHFPFMWNSVYSHAGGQNSSSYFGDDESTLWQGLWVPHGKPRGQLFYPQAIYRGHPMNVAQIERTAADGITTAANTMFPTLDTTEGLVRYGDRTYQNRLVSPENSSHGSYYAGSFYEDVADTLTSAPNHQLWYPIIKFRGARLTYITDRPGHGGWGG